MQIFDRRENTAEYNDKRYKYLGTISVLFVSVLLISNIVSTKIIDLGFFSFDGGTLIFPLSYIFGDILTEVYGYRQSRRVIWLGFVCALLMSITIMVIGKLPADQSWPNQSAYDVILGLTPRLVIASLIAYFAGEFSNAIILAKLKIITKGKWLWSRTIGSTIVGELVDSLLFILIAFYGILPRELLVSIIISNYVFKLGFEVVLTPVTYKVVNYLKKSENEDFFDTDTNFNPMK
ncbi:MAG: queuosine precursor transporter [Patescibacteria group bacterium]